MKNILFVCTGNTCRSSMAEVIFKSMLQESGKKVEGIKVDSAGIYATLGQSASVQAISAMREEGIDLTAHQSKPLTKKMIHEADLILTMTVNHKKRVLQMEANAEEKVFTLKEYALEDRNLDDRLEELSIHDPFGQPVENYKASAEEIKEALKKVLEKLEKDNE